MTTVRIKAGICGLATVVIAERMTGRKIKVTLSSECDMVSKMAEEIKELNLMVIFNRFLDNPVYQAASRYLKHVTCPVPCGILKAVEVEAGLALPRDVHISIEKA